MEGGGFAIRTCASGNAPRITKGPRAKSQSTSNCLCKVTPLHSPVCCLLSHRSGVWYAGASLLHLLGQEGSSGEGNGAPLQSSCLENPMDGGAWWAAVYGVRQSWKRLKRLSSCRSSSSSSRRGPKVKSVKGLRLYKRKPLGEKLSRPEYYHREDSEHCPSNTMCSFATSLHFLFFPSYFWLIILGTVGLFWFSQSNILTIEHLSALRGQVQLFIIL